MDPGREAACRLNRRFDRRGCRECTVSVGGVAITGLAQRSYQASQACLKAEDSGYGAPQFVDDEASSFNRRRPQCAISIFLGSLETRSRPGVPLLRDRNLRISLSGRSPDLAQSTLGV
jgi:hypothetical protein